MASPREIVEDWFDAFARGDMTAARALLDDQSVVHALDRDLHGFDETLAWFESRSAHHEFSYEVDELLGGARHAVALLTLSDGVRRWPQVAVYRVSDARIAEVWLYEGGQRKPG